MQIYEELVARGLIAQVTNDGRFPAALSGDADKGPRKLCGLPGKAFDGQSAGSGGGQRGLSLSVDPSEAAFF